MTWILPTLSRPQQCAAVLNRMRETGCSTPGIVVLNGDQGFSGAMPEGWSIIVPDKNLGALGALNKVFELYPNEDFYGFIGDDEFVETDGWDKKLIDAAGAWNFSHGIDSLHGGKRAQGYLCIGGKLARAVGYLALPEAHHWYGLDSLWEALAHAGACEHRCVGEVKIEHRHPYGGKAEWDSCYELGEKNKDIDFQVCAHWLRHKLRETVERVKKARDA